MKIKIKMFSGNHSKDDKGCLMVFVHNPIQEFLLSKIDSEDIYIDPDDPIFGLEKDAHVTVLYGFPKQEDPSRIFDIAGLVKKPEVLLTKISHFNNDKYDVLKFDVKSPQIVSAHFRIKDLIKVDTDYPDFHPHLTIAYLKKGTASKYEELFGSIQNLIVDPTKLVLNNTMGEEISKLY